MLEVLILANCSPLLSAELKPFMSGYAPYYLYMPTFSNSCHGILVHFCTRFVPFAHNLERKKSTIPKQMLLVGAKMLPIYI